MGRHRPSQAFQDAVEPGVRIPRIEPLHTRVDRNRWRITGFLLLFTLAAAVSLFVALLGVVTIAGIVAVGAAGFAIEPDHWYLIGNAMAFGFLVSLILSTLWVAARVTTAEVALTKRLQARIPHKGEALETKSVLRDMALASGLPRTPPLFIIDAPGVNAFALGSTPASLRVGVTQGMLDRIPLPEQRAVFANLIARVLAGDTQLATLVSVLMGPAWAMRDYDLRFQPTSSTERAPGAEQTLSHDWRATPLLFYGVAVIVTEILAWYHQEAAWQTAEKADAEGMILLKDPRSMLRAIEHVLERDNHVPSAGDAYSQLFFCWAGFGFAPEDDPEMRRVGRLRETLGAEGAARLPRPNVPDWSNPPVPPPPWVELERQIERGKT